MMDTHTHTIAYSVHPPSHYIRGQHTINTNTHNRQARQGTLGTHIINTHTTDTHTPNRHAHTK